MDRYLTELVGTFFLVLAIGMTAIAGTGFAPLAVASMLMAMVYMGGHVSGAHYNPAVSLALAVQGAFDRRHLVPYVVAQVAGALLAALAVLAIGGDTFAPAPGPGAGLLGVLLSEALLTFALVLVILHVAVAPGTSGNHSYGLAIGFVVGAGAFAVGPISGGAFNPAVGIGPTLVHAVAGDGSLGDLWIYLVAPVAGGLAACPVYEVQARGR